MELEHVLPEEIERRSFEIISQELKAYPEELERFGSRELEVVKRCIHTTADPEFIRTMYFSKGALDTMEGLIKNGAVLVTDTNMALAGINKRELERYGCEAECFMADEEVRREALETGRTRASVSAERAMRIEKPVIFVSGNAPTALITLREAYDRGDRTPSFIIGVPVGFVNVVQAKELILETEIPCIVNRGRKGGSTVAAAIVNAVLYGMKERYYQDNNK